jgi:hypothetical protein
LHFLDRCFRRRPVVSVDEAGVQAELGQRGLRRLDGEGVALPGERAEYGQGGPVELAGRLEPFVRLELLERVLRVLAEDAVVRSLVVAEVGQLLLEMRDGMTDGMAAGWCVRCRFAPRVAPAGGREQADDGERRRPGSERGTNRDGAV